MADASAAARAPASIPEALREDSPVTALHGVGPRLAGRLARLDIGTVGDLLLHLPNRYQDRTRVVPIAELRVGSRARVEAEVVDARIKQGRRRTWLITVADASGQLVLCFFHFSPAQQQALRIGSRVWLFGEVREGFDSLEMVHPEHGPVPDAGTVDAAEAPGQARLTPLYPLTEGLGQVALRALIGQVLGHLEVNSAPPLVAELLPARLAAPGLAEALRYLHRPPVDADTGLLESGLHPLQRRLALEELLAHHLSLRQLRDRLQRRRAPSLTAPGELARRLREGLPFRLTGAQDRAIREILADLARQRPMQRLLQGDVGSGKTLVAASVILQCVEAGCQAAIMAPTEILAEQHRASFGAWLEPLGIELAWLSGRQKGKARGQVLEAVAEGRARVVVGTHALFQTEVQFHDLGLVVIDEQHRFGVHQRLALREKGRNGDLSPHQLIMTATPIPRTLAMTAYADLDISVIDELPAGRSEVKTAVIPETRRDEVVERVRRVCREQGRQAYWVCTLIEESESLQAEAAGATAERLAEELPELRIGLVHGRMGGKDKDAVMRAFKSGERDLLVATTVIEVGVDVPNASLMVIENAERLGLAQLHQLRGRVGRGTVASACVLMYRPPLSDIARSRLGILRDTADGFQVAQRDLELRGPGEVLGTRQTGEMRMRVADLLRDADLLQEVERIAAALLAQYPGNVPGLIARWVREGGRYGEV